MSIDRAIQAIEEFQGQSLTDGLATIESEIVGLGFSELQQFCGTRGINGDVMSSAVSIKKLAGQINVVIHAVGILCSLPHILKPGEVVESVSLGAGNTGKQFDLETNFRVAEYKFIDWRGGSETIRQNSVFKDFFELGEHATAKSKHLYVIGTKYPLKFLTSKRSLTSVLNRFPEIHKQIVEKYGSAMTKVCHYYELKKSAIEIFDVSPYVGRGA